MLEEEMSFEGQVFGPHKAQNLAAENPCNCFSTCM